MGICGMPKILNLAGEGMFLAMFLAEGQRFLALLFVNPTNSMNTPASIGRGTSCKGRDRYTL